ncbi:MAG TPA: non-homologous end-joining DNA ligase [Verrucomicrobiae bacterium]|jgi:bifunctional non-homologous end joining protein LigD|nr:non-homologous end-joining DNA ligase [Verrucomicrobiae bacterium]
MTRSAPSERGTRRRTSVTVKIEGRTLELSNLDKPFYPAGFTKGEMIDYYVKAAPYLLPHVSRRPLTLKRYPEGTSGDFFYEKEAPFYRPDWVPTVSIKSRHKPRPIEYLYIDGTAALVWVLNLASIELHPFLYTADSLYVPTCVAFDLDPGAPANIVDCCEIGLRMKGLFEKLGLKCFPKVSGGKGLHLYVPLNTRATFEETKNFARSVALTLEKHDPERVTSVMAKAVRPGKIFVDWSQNDEHKTTCCVYSLRARAKPWASAPVTWKEVEACLAKKNPALLDFEAEDVIDRAERSGDLFEPVLALRQELPGEHRAAA